MSYLNPLTFLGKVKIYLSNSFITPLSLAIVFNLKVGFFFRYYLLVLILLILFLLELEVVRVASSIIIDYSIDLRIDP